MPSFHFSLPYSPQRAYKTRETLLCKVLTHFELITAMLLGVPLSQS